MLAQSPPVFLFNRHNQGTILGYGGTEVKKTGKKVCLYEAYFLGMHSPLVRSKIQGPYDRFSLFTCLLCLP